MPSKFFNVTGAGALGVLRFIIKHWYTFVIILVILPSIMNAIAYAKETNNPSYPIMALGLRITNADSLINADVETLKTNPADLVGMEKPTEGLWFKTLYWWKFFWNVIWATMGNIFLISVPFVFFFKVFRTRNVSEPAKNVILSIIFGLLFIFVINLIVVVHALISESFFLTIPDAPTFWEEAWWIIKSTMPFHGIINLFTYIVSSFA